MPIPYNLAAEIARRLSKGANVADLKDALAPTSHDERPVPPPVPGRGETNDDAVRISMSRWRRRKGHWSLATLEEQKL
jgi:hypothetical protein